MFDRATITLSIGPHSSILYFNEMFSVSCISVFESLNITQPPTLSGTGNEYQPKCGDALRLGSKGRHGSFYLWINVWVAGKTVRSLVNTCHT